MRILVDIGHPAHVHYFRNMIYLLRKQGHKISITTRDKDVSIKLLDAYGFEYVCTGRNYYSKCGKMWSLLRNEFNILVESLRFKPDVFLSCLLPFPAHIGSILRKPVIGLTDTEHARMNHALAKPFTDAIIVPTCFKHSMGKKEIRFNGFLELCYLHPNYFTPDPSILDLLGVKKDEKYLIMRFVSWHASHDIGHRGLSLEMKRKAVREFSKYARVFISSEGELPQDLTPYELKIPPEKMHDVLDYAYLYFGESGTMATEAALLGTPAVRVSTIAKLLGNYKELQNKYKLLYFFDSEYEGFNKALELLQNSVVKEKWKLRRDKLLADKIDVTAFMVWFVENYPDSFKRLRKDPDYQLRFK